MLTDLYVHSEGIQDENNTDGEKGKFYSSKHQELILYCQFVKKKLNFTFWPSPWTFYITVRPVWWHSCH